MIPLGPEREQQIRELVAGRVGQCCEAASDLLQHIEYERARHAALLRDLASTDRGWNRSLGEIAVLNRVVVAARRYRMLVLGGGDPEEVDAAFDLDHAFSALESFRFSKPDELRDRIHSGSVVPPHTGSEV